MAYRLQRAGSSSEVPVGRVPLSSAPATVAHPLSPEPTGLNPNPADRRVKQKMTDH